MNPTNPTNPINLSREMWSYFIGTQVTRNSKPETMSKRFQFLSP